MGTALIVCGVILELLGITLLALDVIAEPAKRCYAAGRAAGATVRSRAAARMRRVWDRLRRRKTVIVTAGSARASGHSPTISVSGEVTPSLDDPTRLLAWLREQAVETRDRLRALERSVAEDRATTARALRDLDRDLRELVAAAVAASEGAYRGWRLTGFVLAIAGVTITLIGTVVSL